MAERDFRLQPDTTDAATRNFALNEDEATVPAQGVIQKIDLPLGTPDFEEMLARTREILARDGYDQTTINSLTQPLGVNNEIDENLDFQGIYNSMKPLLDENRASIEETWKIAQQQAEDGVDLNAFDWSATRRLIMRYGEENIEGMAEARGWWRNLMREVGDRAGDAVAEGTMDFSLGLSLLDVFSWINKKTKLQFVPKEQRAELESRVLPKITLESGKEYSNGTSAAIEVIGQRLWGLGEQIVGAGISSAGGFLANQPLRELGIGTMEQGEERMSQAQGQIPNLVSALGPRLSWQEVVERNWDQVTDVEDIYRELDDMGVYGDIIMGGIAFGDGLAEIVGDPALIVGGMTASIPGLARKGVARVAPQKLATVAAQTARRTFRLEDGIEAVAAAEKNLRSVEDVAHAQIDATRAAVGQGSMSVENARRIILAREALAKEKKWLSQFQDAGPNEVILPRTSRRNPDHLPSARVTERYTEHVPTKGPIIAPEQKEKLAREAHQEIKKLRKQRTKTPPGTQREAVDARIQVLERDIKRVILRPTKPGQTEIGFERFETRTKSVGELGEEMHLVRKQELERGFDTPLDWNKVDDLPLFQKRQLMGPDDAEQAGDGLNLMVRTGGVGVDDVATTPQAVEHTIMPESQLSLIDWRAIDKHNLATRAERQFLSTSGARQFELGVSTQRSLARQKDIARRNLGFARQQKNRDKARLYAGTLKDIKKAEQRLAGGLTTKAKKYDDTWLPKHQPGITEDPGRFNRWLAVAGDRAVRSLYPGGLQIKPFGDTRLGQIFAPLREPQRFYDTYNPAAWDRIRSSYLRYHRQSQAWYDEVLTGAEKAGVVSRRGKFDPRKDFSPFSIDEAKNRELFDLLDTPTGTEEFDELAAAASPGLLKFHDQIRKKLNHAADIQGISDTPKFLTGYIRHVFDYSQFGGGARPLEYIGLPAKAEVFASHLLPRTGRAGYPRDAMLALDVYGRAMNRKIIIEPMYDDIIQTGSELAKKHNNPMFQSYANDFVHQLKGKPQFVGKKIDEWIGGALNKDGAARWKPDTIDRTLMGVSGMIWAGSLPGNPRYPIMQIATGIATTASRFGMFRTSRALWEMGTLEGQAINKQIGTYDTFLDIFESDFMRRFSQFVTKRGYTVTPFGIMSTAQTEEYIRGATALAAVDMHMTKMGFASWDEAAQAGMSNRIAFEALRSSEEVNHMFGALGRSPWATRTLAPQKGMAVAATQFLSFIPKQTEELLSQANRNPGMLIKYLAMSGWMSRIAAEELGIDVTNYVGLGYIPEKLDEFSSPAVDAFVNNLNFLQAAASRDPQKTSDAATELLASLETLIPFMVAFNTAGKSAQRLSEGEQETIGGEKHRPLDFTEVLPDNLATATPEQLGAAIRPNVLPEVAAGDALPGLGGDLLPTAFGQQNIRENLFRRGQQAIRRENKRFFFNLQKTVREVTDAWEDGNLTKMEESITALENTYNIRISSSEPFERAIEAREISWFLRQIEANPKLIDRFLKIGQDFGLAVQP